MGVRGETPRSQDKDRPLQKPHPAKGNPFSTFLPPRTSDPRQPATQPPRVGRDPRTVHTDAESLCPIARSCTLRDRDESSCGSGHSSAIVDTELVVSLKTTAPISLIHRGVAALLRVRFVPGRVCCDRWRGEHEDERKRRRQVAGPRNPKAQRRRKWLKAKRRPR